MTVYKILTRSLITGSLTIGAQSPKKKVENESNIDSFVQWFLLAICCYKLKKTEECLFALSKVKKA
jgi:hypothetical protein